MKRLIPPPVIILAMLMLLASCTQYVLYPLPDWNIGNNKPSGPVTVTPSDTADPDWYNTGSSTLSVEDAGDLLAFREAANAGLLDGKTIRFDNDFNLSGYDWTPAAAGGRSRAVTSFSGTIDGRNHKISGLSINVNDADVSVGFIGNAGDLTVKNLTFENVTVNAPNADSVGAVVGYVNGSLNLSDVTVTGSINGADGTSGIAGRVYAADSDDTISLSNVTNNATVTAPKKAGGIIGSISSSSASFASLTMTNVSNEGAVTSPENGTGTGGIIGYLAETAHIEMNTVTNTGAITVNGAGANDTAGGIIGILVAEENMTGTLTGLRNEADISSGNQAGGIVGRMQGSTDFELITLQAPVNTGKITGGEGTGLAGGIIGYGGFRIVDADNSGAIAAANAGGIAGDLTSRTEIIGGKGGTAAITGTNAGRIAGKVSSAQTAAILSIDNDNGDDVTTVGELGLFDGNLAGIHLTSGKITGTPAFVGARTYYIELDEGTSINLDDEKFKENAKVYEGPCKLTIINSDITVE